MDTEQVFGTPAEACRLIAATTGSERVKWVLVAQAWSCREHSRNSGGRGRHHRLDAGQSRLQRGFLGVVERCLQYGTAFTLQTFEHLVRCNLAHPDK